MDIKKRINARKVVLAYYYQHCFFLSLEKKLSPDAVLADPAESMSGGTSTSGMLDSGGEFLDFHLLQTIQEKKDQWDKIDDLPLKKVKDYQTIPSLDGVLQYYLDYFFDQWDVETIDIDYVMQMMPKLSHYQSTLIDLVNQYSHSFGFEKMDILDQALFLLAYVESQVLGTPKSVIINEVIELAKRYSDPGSPKLLNGLLDKIFQDLV